MRHGIWLENQWTLSVVHVSQSIHASKMAFSFRAYPYKYKYQPIGVEDSKQAFPYKGRWSLLERRGYRRRSQQARIPTLNIMYHVTSGTNYAVLLVPMCSVRQSSDGQIEEAHHTVPNPRTGHRPATAANLANLGVIAREISRPRFVCRRPVSGFEINFNPSSN